MCDSDDFGQLRATVGNFDIGRGQTNVIPREAILTIDLRNPLDDHMTAAEEHLASYVDKLAVQHGVDISWERMAKTAAVPFDAGIQNLLAATAKDLGLSYVRAMSGAGHDAQEIAAICPTAMIFIAGQNGGISHSPREYSDPDACARGTDVLRMPSSAWRASPNSTGGGPVDSLPFRPAHGEGHRRPPRGTKPD